MISNLAPVGEEVRVVKCGISRATAPLDSMWPLNPWGTRTLFRGRVSLMGEPVLGVMVMVEVLVLFGAEAQSTEMVARIVEGPEG